MSVASKEQALPRFREAHEAFMGRLASTPPAAGEQAVGESWSLTDLVAHLAGGHEEMAAAAERILRGEPPRPAGLPLESDDEANARFVARFQGVGPSDVAAALSRAFERCLAAFGALPAALFETGGGPTRWLLDECEHYQEHANQLPR